MTQESPNPTNASLKMNIRVDDDDMLAHLRVSYTKRFNFYYQDAFRLLNENKIVFGIQHDNLKKLEKEYRGEHKEGEVFEILAAKGLPKIPCEDGRVEFFIKKKPPVVIDESGKADFRNIERFTTVDQGEVLARVYPPKEGKAGMDIYGHEVVPREPRTPQLEVGKNVGKALQKAEYQDYIAKVHGIYIHNKSFIDVNPELRISDSVGLESGNVKYDGNVIVGHNIERGSKVECKGDLKVRGMVESENIQVGGSMMVDKGIHTSHSNLLKVQGDLSAFYIDNSRIFVEGSIEVRRSINASEIICMGDLYVSDKNASISGGDIFCYGSIASSTIGNKAETVTHITLGSHVKNIELLKREIHNKDVLTENYEHSVLDVKKVNDQITRMRGNVPAEKRLQFRQTFQEYKTNKAKLERCLANIEKYKRLQYNKDSVRLIVRDMLYPGVVIHYRTHIERITAPLSKCILKFTPAHEGPIMSAWKPE